MILRKEELQKIFEYSENFGYDFMSKIKKNEIRTNYNIAIENLEHIESIIEDMYPDQNSNINLTELFNDRLIRFSINLVE